MNGERTAPEALRIGGDEDSAPSRLRWLMREYGSTHRRSLLLGIGTSVWYPVLAVLPPFFIHIAIDGVLLQSRPVAIPALPPTAIPSERFAQLVLVGGLVVTSAVGAGVLSAIGTLSWGRFAQATQHDLRADTYALLQERPLAFFERTQPGQLLSVLSNDLDELDRLIQHGGKQAIEIAVQFVGVSVVLLALHWQLAVVAFLVIPVLWGASRWFYSEMQPVYVGIRQHLGILNAHLENNLRGIRTIQAYGREATEAERIAARSGAVFRAKWRATVLQGIFYPAAGMVNVAGLALLLGVGGYWIIEGPPPPFTSPLTVGTLVAFLLYNQQLRAPLVEAGGVMDAVVAADASLRRIRAIRDGKDARLAHDRREPPDASGELRLAGVTYAYRCDRDPVVSDISMHIEAGSFVGIVGPTGSGKTTVAHLLMGLFRPDEGEIKLDGVPVARLERSARSRSIAIVSQEPYLFTGTVEANVTYGAPDASPSEIETALALSEALEFVRELDDGLETAIGHGGVTLSGGQRQRLAIARAILSNPRVLILDEATSHVDAWTEARLRATFRTLAGERTVIAITHRLGTVRHADRIFVLADGRVVERGSHKSLVRNDGEYARLWREETLVPAGLPEGETTSR